MHAQLAKPSPLTHSFKHSCIWLTALVYLASYSRSSSRTRSLISHALTFTLSTCSHAKVECLLSLSPSHSHLPLSWTSRTEVEDHNLRISRGSNLRTTKVSMRVQMIRRQTQLPRLHGVHASCCRSCSCQLSSHNPSAALSTL